MKILAESVVTEKNFLKNVWLGVNTILYVQENLYRVKFRANYRTIYFI